jgi:F0F1-type ATP synthase assembly protein I
MNKKQLEQEMLNDYHQNKPVGMVICCIFGICAMIVAFTYLAMSLVNWIVK